MKRAHTKLTAGLKTRSFRIGGYSVIATVVVLAIAIMANVFVNALPASVTQLDTTSNQLFSISEQTKKITASLEEQVSIYWIVQQGQEDTNVEMLLSRYESLSDEIQIIRKDPDVYPTFVQQYSSEGVYNNSLIVESSLRYSYISYYDIYEYDYSTYYTTGSYSVNFAGESMLTAAIDYVINEELPVLYVLTGHGEESISDNFSSAIEKQNISVQELSLLTVDEVPEDADCVLIYSPKNDISAEEEGLLLNYIASGGSLILITDPLEDGQSRSHLESVMAEYGMAEKNGVVLETDRSHYAFGTPYYLLPELMSHSITSPLISSGYYVLLPIAHGLTVNADLRDSLTVTELLTTSNGSYSKSAGYAMETYEKEDGDEQGPFALAIVANEGASKVIWISSGAILEDQADAQVAGGNQDFFLNCLNTICGQESSISIHSKSLAYEYLTMNSATAARLSTLVVGILPAACLSIGIVIWVRRKRR